MADVMVLTNLWPTIMSAFGAGSGFTVACCIRWGASPCYLDQDETMHLLQLLFPLLLLDQ